MFTICALFPWIGIPPRFLMCSSRSSKDCQSSLQLVHTQSDHFVVLLSACSRTRRVQLFLSKEQKSMFPDRVSRLDLEFLSLASSRSLACRHCYSSRCCW